MVETGNSDWRNVYEECTQPRKLPKVIAYGQCIHLTVAIGTNVAHTVRLWSKQTCDSQSRSQFEFDSLIVQDVMPSRANVVTFAMPTKSSHESPKWRKRHKYSYIWAVGNWDTDFVSRDGHIAKERPNRGRRTAYRLVHACKACN